MYVILSVMLREYRAMLVSYQYTKMFLSSAGSCRILLQMEFYYLDYREARAEWFEQKQISYSGPVFVKL